MKKHSNKIDLINGHNIAVFRRQISSSEVSLIKCANSNSLESATKKFSKQSIESYLELPIFLEN